MFAARFPLIGMVHLPPLPGHPDYPGMEAVLAAAERDAQALAGLDGALVENYGDAPFAPTVEPPALAALTLAIDRVRAAFAGPVGVNVLRCDPAAALGIAAATGAAFVRLNVHTWPIITDQGLLQGRAAATVRARAALCPGCELWVDVAVKHGRSLAPSLAQEVRDTVARGRADRLLWTGDATGAEADAAGLAEVRALAPDTPVLVASGITAANLARYREADGAIVGTWLRPDGAVEPARVAALRAARAALGG